jgi:hypothetical protein
MVTLSELELQRNAVCSMYVEQSVDYLIGPAERTFRWAVRQRHNGIICTPKMLRERFLDDWKKSWEGAIDDTYWVGPKAAAPFGRRVYEFLLKYEVLRPFEPYQLQLEHGQIHGQNALVLWRKLRQEPVTMVLDVRMRRPRDYRTLHYPALAQWAAARLEVETTALGIVHLPLVWGERWTTTDVDEALAQRWLDGIVKQVSDQRLFPRVGAQCASCTHPCKEIFRGSNDDRWD